MHVYQIGDLADFLGRPSPSYFVFLSALLFFWLGRRFLLGLVSHVEGSRLDEVLLHALLALLAQRYVLNGDTRPLLRTIACSQVSCLLVSKGTR